jgi:facilitated trehalose transporter
MYCLCFCFWFQVSESARPRIRGMLGFLPSIMNALGVLLGLLVGCWISWRKVAIMMSIVPVGLLILSLWLPESPFWLMSHGHEERAFKSLQRLRGSGRSLLQVQEELDEMKASVKEMNSPSACKLGWTDCIWRKENWMAFTLIIFQQLCGVSSVIYYLQMILSETKVQGNPSVNPENAAWCVGLVHLAAFFVSFPLIDRIGRRWLLIVSGILMSLSHTTLAVYMYFMYEKDMGFLQFTSSWLPLTSLSLFIGAFSIGETLIWLNSFQFLFVNLNNSSMYLR